MRAKILTLAVVCFVAFFVSAKISIKRHRVVTAEVEAKAQKKAIDDLEKQVNVINKQMEAVSKATAEMEEQTVRGVGNGITSTVHDKYENSFIQYVEGDTVQVQTVDSRLVIVFKPAQKDLRLFRPGWIAPVTFQCREAPKDKCDFSKPFTVSYVSGVSVETILTKKIPSKN